MKISAQKSYLDWDLNNALNNTFYKCQKMSLIV